MKSATNRRRSPRAGGAGETAEKLANYLPGTQSPSAPAGDAVAGVLPDTCAWIDFLAGREAAVTRLLAVALRESPVFTCGPVLAELLQGTRGDHDREVVLGVHRSLEYAETTAAVWVRAGDLASTLRREGITVPLSDLLIAAIALELRLEIITRDKHFGMIPGVRTREEA